MFKKAPLFLLLCFGVAWAAGCDTKDRQDDFEDRAFGGAPSGFVQTRQEPGTGACVIESEDEDDWVTSPAYETNVTVTPACPNPVLLSGFARIPVSIQGLTPGRFSVQALNTAGRLEQLDIIDHGGNGFDDFRVNAAVLGRPGLHRLFILDPAFTLVSYGDVMVVE